MTTTAIVMMVISMLVLWGGLGLAILNISRSDRHEPGPADAHRDL